MEVYISRLDFRRLPGPVFDHFPEQRLVIEPSIYLEQARFNFKPQIMQESRFLQESFEKSPAELYILTV